MSMSLTEAAPFVTNPEPRCPCIVLVDVSGSMSGAPIRALNEGLRTLHGELISDSLAAKRVELCVIAFDDIVEIIHDFSTIDQFAAPALEARGATHTGTAVLAALDKLQERVDLYKRVGVRSYRPWVFLITDGAPTESREIYQRAALRVHQLETDKKVCFFAVGVVGADMATLGQLTPRAALKLQGLNFRELFLWLSQSLSGVSRSKLGDQVPLQPPSGWATV